MSGFTEYCAAEGVRRVSVKVPRGAIRIERIDGDTIVVRADEALEVDRHDDQLRIGIQSPISGGRARADWPGPQLRFPEGLEFTFGSGFGEQLSSLGSQISDAVASVLKSLGGQLGADVVIGIPAIVEHPTISVVTGMGDLHLEGLNADLGLRTGLGTVQVLRCEGALAVHTGKGDILTDCFVGDISCLSGAGDIRIQSVKGKVETRTGHGDLNLNNCTAGGDLQTGAGEIMAGAVDGVWNIRSGHGDIAVSVSRLASLDVTTGSGDVDVSGGELQRLKVHSSTGDIHCDSLLVGPQHELISGHGDLVLLLANPPGARLQILTGHGDISSDFPLVRVGRQGPPSHGSARFVGNVGDSSIDVLLRTGAGDIRVARKIGDGSANFHGRQEPDALSDTPEYNTSKAADHHANQSVSVSTASPAGASGAPESEQTGSIRSDGNSESSHAVGIKSVLLPTSPDLGAAEHSDVSGHNLRSESADGERLRILESLQRGEISVKEATVLLGSLSGATR